MMEEHSGKSLSLNKMIIIVIFLLFYVTFLLGAQEKNYSEKSKSVYNILISYLTDSTLIDFNEWFPLNDFQYIQPITTDSNFVMHLDGKNKIVLVQYNEVHNNLDDAKKSYDDFSSFFVHSKWEGEKEDEIYYYFSPSGDILVAISYYREGIFPMTSVILTTPEYAITGNF
jgi:hypothetical protein